MTKKWSLLTIPALLLVVVLVAAFAVSPTPALGASTVDDLISQELDAKGSADIFVKMASDANLDAAEGIANKVDRRQFVYDTLTAHAAAAQADITRYLDSRGVSYDVYWINNSLFVHNADRALVRELARRGDVAYLRGNHQVPLHVPVAIQAADAAGPTAIEWGVDMVNAPDVWGQGNTGQGIVVANIDTGVRWTHQALDGQYRGAGGSHDYNWWDPDLVYAAPTDNNGHGTHTMGTMVGDDGGANQIGVAPGARWIAAQGCDGVFCTDSDLISSAQWIACPTRVNGTDPNCAMAPDVVNNSWGGSGGNSWYQSYTDSWVSAGIIPVFSAGNSGPSCSTTGSPGDYRKVIGVGAVDINKALAYFSSKGPGAFKPLKPDVVAPGQNVRSSYNSNDSSYASLSGTSMAAPHVAGAVALLLADSPGSSLKDIILALYGTTDQALPAPQNSPNNCGGRDYFVYPNPIYGRGLIDALGAANALP